MNWSGWLIWGFAATVVLTTLASASQGLGLTRMSIPYLLGTMVTVNRDRAKVVGFLLHLVNGLIFSLLYVLAFHQWGGPSVGKGVAIGVVHAAFVLTAGMKSMPGLHPRMAGEEQGPTVVRQLEPPGFLALNYGATTPVAIVLAHAVFGGILGLMYRV